MKYGGNYPLFISYDAIDKLRNNDTIKKLWSSSGAVEEFFKSNLVNVLSDPLAGKPIKDALGKVYLYDGKQAELFDSDFDDKGRATIIAAAITGGAKMYQQGGGSRLPGPLGIVKTWKRNKEEVLTSLGIPKDRWPEYKQMMVSSTHNWGDYEKALSEAKSADVNIFVYADPNTQTYFHYVSSVEVTRNLNARVQIEGRRMSDDDILKVVDGSDNEKALKAAYGKLGTPTADSGWVLGTQLNRKDRGDGQAKAMNNWNALGAAAYANRFLGASYSLTQNWEWLHIRGAQIGGATDSTNLVPGLYVTNSFMIPYENMIEQWARADPTHFSARFRVQPTGTLYGRYITISFKAEGHSMLGDLEQNLVTFDALAGRVIDKLANEIVKRNIDKRATAD